MQVECAEYDCCFHITLSAEDKDDASFLTRMAVNRKEEVHVDVSSCISGNFDGQIWVQKRIRTSSSIPKAR